MAFSVGLYPLCFVFFPLGSIDLMTTTGFGADQLMRGHHRVQQRFSVCVRFVPADNSNRGWFETQQQDASIQAFTLHANEPRPKFRA